MLEVWSRSRWLNGQISNVIRNKGKGEQEGARSPVLSI